MFCFPGKLQKIIFFLLKSCVVTLLILRRFTVVARNDRLLRPRVPNVPVPVLASPPHDQITHSRQNERTLERDEEESLTDSDFEEGDEENDNALEESGKWTASEE